MRWALASLLIQIGCLAVAQEPPRARPIPLELGDVVNAVAFTPDGKSVVGAGGSVNFARAVTDIRIWDGSGKLLREMRGQPLPTCSLALSPDGTVLASAPYSMMRVGATSVHLWDPAAGTLIGTLAGHEETIHTVAFSPDGSKLVSGGVDGTIRVWDVAARKQLASLRTPFGAVTQALFLPDGKTIVSGARDTHLRLWDWASGKETASVDALIGGCVSLCVSADGRRIASVSGDGVVRLGELASFQAGVTLTAPQKKVRVAAFSPDGRFLGTVADDGLRIWELATQKEACRIAAALGPLAFSPDGRRIATGSAMSGGSLWDLAADAPKIDLASPETGKLLRDPDAAVATRAAWGIALQGEAAVAWIQSRLTPPSPEAVAKAFARLDDDDIRVREAAFQEFLSFGPAVESDLRAKLLANPAEQLRRPLEDLLRRLDGPVAGSPYLAERSRCLFVLETVGGAAAARLLEEISTKGKSAWERTEAAASLRRLKARKP